MRIGHIDVMLLAGFSSKLEPDLSAADLRVPILEGREPEGFVLTSVLVIPYTDETRFQQLDDGGQDFVFRQTGQSQIPGELFADFWPRLGERQHARVFRFITNLPPFGMIPVLLAAARISARSLHMTVGPGTNPNIFPGRGDGQTFDSGKLPFISQRATSLILVNK